MFGIVEARGSYLSVEKLDSEAGTVAGGLADALAEWRG